MILGCVDPVGEAGSDIARAAVFEAGYDNSVGGIQVNRFCASGLDAVNFAASKIAAGSDEVIIAGGVESMSRVGMGMSGGAWPMDPSVARSLLLHAAGRFGRSHRHEIRLLAR